MCNRWSNKGAPRSLAIAAGLLLSACDPGMYLQADDGASSGSSGGSSSGGSSSGGSSSGGSSSGSSSSGGSSSGGSSSGGGSSGGGSSSSGSSSSSSSSGGSSGGGSTPRSAGCGKATSLRSGRINIQSNGSRSYLLRIPDNYDGERPYRLIFSYHWSGATAQSVAGDWYGLLSLAENSTIFVAPEGLNQGWANANGQDVAFTDAILAQLESELCIDKSRIFANGFSYGGGMSYAIACARADVFRGVVIYSGGLLSGCSGGTTPIAFYASHGMSETGMPAGRGCTGLRDHFAEVNGCTSPPPPDPPAGSGTHRCTTYEGCSEGHPVTYCSFDGGHMWNPVDRGQMRSWNPTESWKFITQF